MQNSYYEKMSSFPFSELSDVFYCMIDLFLTLRKSGVKHSVNTAHGSIIHKQEPRTDMVSYRTHPDVSILL